MDFGTWSTLFFATSLGGYHPQLEPLASTIFVPCRMMGRVIQSNQILIMRKKYYTQINRNYTKGDSASTVVIWRQSRSTDITGFANLTSASQVTFLFSWNKLERLQLSRVKINKGVDQLMRLILLDQSACGDFGYQICEMG